MPVRKSLLMTGAVLGAMVALGASGYRADLPYEAVRAHYETPQSRWAEVAGAQIHYTDQGSGPALVFLHGSGAELGAFSQAAPALTGRGYRVITLDLPGSGLSVAGPKTGFRNADNTALIAAFLDAIDVQPAALVGHSTGGQIAWTLGLDAPERTPRLILLAPTGQPTPSPLTWQVAKLPVLGAMLKNVTPQMVVRQNLKDAVFDDTRITPAIVARYHDLLLREGARDALFERMQNVTFERIDELPCLAQPVLLLWGTEDIWLPPALGQAFAEAIPQAQLTLIEQVGHNLPEELAPDVLAQLIDDWLRQPMAPSETQRPAHCATVATL